MWSPNYFIVVAKSQSSKLHISTLSLLVSRMCLAKHKQAASSTHKETIFAAPLQGRLCFHSISGLDAGKMLTLSQQGRSARRRLDVADSG